MSEQDKYRNELLEKGRTLLNEHTEYLSGTKQITENPHVSSATFFIMKIAELQLQVEKLQEDKK